ncbi:uncharacterized protein ASCRUDRAFT_74045 [Ascoidea rubescens DSM 1968]|uniref:RING-type domain-containing protein n=1 Tax=Ascoidea rubescens DSM 1968 TaxID=1344418 RepID=A0A1D2VS26_9ASCO|nr:hypothetical protein ASCRUDRAFT_74045 [Ascoidea rubescens DSM 1968]ODV64414.1 hypothetical protein ASCRUDRAFT_74045 [Ascoidea rubescens DSM 1968]
MNQLPEQSESSSDALDLEDICSICLDNLFSNGSDVNSNAKKQLVARLGSCNHRYHDICIRPWCQKSNSCPSCRTSFKKVDLVDVDGNVVHNYTVEPKKPSKVCNDFNDFDASSQSLSDGDLSSRINNLIRNRVKCSLCDSASSVTTGLALCSTCSSCYHPRCLGVGSLAIGVRSWNCPMCDTLQDSSYTFVTGVIRGSIVRESTLRRLNAFEYQFDECVLSRDNNNNNNNNNNSVNNRDNGNNRGNVDYSNSIVDDVDDFCPAPVFSTKRKGLRIRSNPEDDFDFDFEDEDGFDSNINNADYDYDYDTYSDNGNGNNNNNNNNKYVEKKDETNKYKETTEEEEAWKAFDLFREEEKRNEELARSSLSMFSTDLLSSKNEVPFVKNCNKISKSKRNKNRKKRNDIDKRKSDINNNNNNNNDNKNKNNYGNGNENGRKQSTVKLLLSEMQNNKNKSFFCKPVLNNFQRTFYGQVSPPMSPPLSPPSGLLSPRQTKPSIYSDYKQPRFLYHQRNNRDCKGKEKEDLIGIKNILPTSPPPITSEEEEYFPKF